MPSFKKALSSQVGRKIVTGITGIGLVLFLIGHLAGNFSLFAEENAFNLYTYTLESLGPLLYVIEAGLAFIFLYHAILGFSIWRRRKKARPGRYEEYKTKGAPSHQTLASKSMIITGVVILVFVVLHIIHFKFGDAAMITIEGQEMRDLKALVISEFQKPLIAFGYTAVLALMILHLSHGVWSAFTSLGMEHNDTSKKVQIGAYIFGIVLMLGFMFIPLYFFFAQQAG